MERQIEAAVERVDQMVADGEIDRHSRMVDEVTGHGRGNLVRADVDGTGDAEMPAKPVLLDLRDTLDLLQTGDDTSKLRKCLAADVGQYELARRADHQPLTDKLFELGKPFGDGRFRHC